jgi:hypothetical protein
MSNLFAGKFEEGPENSPQIIEGSQ